MLFLVVLIIVLLAFLFATIKEIYVQRKKNEKKDLIEILDDIAWSILLKCLAAAGIVFLISVVFWAISLVFRLIIPDAIKFVDNILIKVISGCLLETIEEMKQNMSEEEN